MKIAIPTKNNQVDDHFGHCEYFMVLTIEDDKIIDTQKIDPGNTCGCKSNIINVLKEEGVETMLAGNMGEGAYKKLTNANMKVVRGCKGNVDTLISEYMAGKVTDQFIMCAPHNHEDGHQCSHS